MAIIALKAWYLQEYEPIRDLEKRPHDIRLSKSSLLKSALRADFLEDSADVKQSAWFQSYLEGDGVEFYIEGSGGYVISNIDLISHEIYFTKVDAMSHLEPTIFFSYQTDYSESGDLLRDELRSVVESINGKSRIPLILEESNRLTDGPVRLKSALMRKIRQSLLFIADSTPIAKLDGNPARVIPSPNVCVEVGYALQSKRSEQILLAQMERPDMSGHFPFDLPSQNRLLFQAKSDLHKALPDLIKGQLKRFNLLP